MKWVPACLLAAAASVLVALAAACAQPAQRPPSPAQPAQVAPGAAAAVNATAQNEQAAADFYRSKTIRIVVGFAPGTNYDAIARLIARYMPQYLPGNPSIIVENKPGASGILAANLVHNAEPKDGTVILLHHEGLVLQQALGEPQIQFDFRKVNWLGSTSRTEGACMVRTDLGVSLQDTIGGKQVVIGGSGPGGDPYDYPLLLNFALGTHFKLVSGYTLPEVMNAIDKQEVDGVCSGVESLQTVGGRLTEGPNPTAKVIVLLGPERPDHPLLRGVPSAEQLARTEEARTLLRLRQAPQRMARPFSVAAEVPRDRVEALRQALSQAYSDPQFRADMEKSKQDLTPGTAQQVAQTVEEVLSTPPAALEKLKTILEEK